MIATILDIVSGLMIVTGGVFVFIGGIGILRMPDFYTRLHAASVTESLGSILLLVGLMIHAGLTLVSAKLLIILVFLLFTSPTSAYAMANASLLMGLKPMLSKDLTKKRESSKNA